VGILYGHYFGPHSFVIGWSGFRPIDLRELLSFKLSSVARFLCKLFLAHCSVISSVTVICLVIAPAAASRPGFRS
jgi:hypothetical protein